MQSNNSVQTSAQKVEEIARTISAEQLREILKKHEEKINGIFSQFRLDPLGMYCRNTGQPCGTYDAERLRQAIQLRGPEHVSEILFHFIGNTVDPLWRDVSPEMLDKLAELDPKGFAVYGLHLLCHLERRERADKVRNSERHWALVRAWHAINFLPEHELAKLNQHLVHALIYAPETIRFIARELQNSANARAEFMPDALAMLALEYKLIPKLETAVRTALGELAVFDILAKQKTRFDNIRKPNEEKSKTVKHAAHGPSHVKLTNIARRRIVSDEQLAKQTAIFRMIDEVFAEENISKLNRYTPLARHATPSFETPQTKSSNVDMSVFDDLFNKDFGDNLAGDENEENDFDANRNEVRTMSVEEALKFEEERYLEKLREKLAERPSVSFAQRLANVKAKIAEPAAPKPVSGLRAHLLAATQKKV